MPLTQSGVKLARSIELKQPGGGIENLLWAGPSMHGSIYRSQTLDGWCRILPIEEVPLQRRQEIRTWVERPTPSGLATITKAYQPAENTEFYLVRYKIAGSVQTLGELLNQASPLARIDSVLKVVRRISQWSDGVGGLILPMPTDIVFDEGGEPILLALPFWRLPSIGAAFEEPSRIFYLSPEIIQGRVNNTSRNPDQYAIGAILLQCFRKLPAKLDPSSALLRAAMGTLLSHKLLASNLPFWMERVRVTQIALKTVNSLVSIDPAIQNSVQWEKILQILESCRKGLDALTAIQEMRQASGGDSAFALLQDILVFQESYELLLLGAEIASHDLGRPLDALDLLEKAIALWPKRPDAYLSHFRIVVAASESVPLMQIFQRNVHIAAQLDAALERDTKFFPDEQRSELVEKLAAHMVWRGQFERALDLIYPNLFENGSYAFWKFRLSLLYAESLIGLGRLEDAEKQLESIRSGLLLVTQNRTMAESEIRLWGNQLDLLRRELLRRR